MWNPELVGNAIVQAFVTLARMPSSGGPRMPGGNWPQTMVEWGDQIGIDPIERRMREEAANRTVVRPTGEEIAHMEDVLDWLKELRAQDIGAAVVTTLWALRTSQGRSLKRLCWEKKWAMRTFWRKRAKGLSWLAEILNSRAIQVWE